MKIIKPSGLIIKAEVSGKVVSVEVVKSNKKTVWVRLGNSDVIKRKIGRDVG